MIRLAPAYLTRLKLNNFRNYRQLSLDLDERHIVLTGKNGAGKTNLLEAVSFLSPGRGLRRVTYDNVALSGSDGSWSIFAELEGAMGSVSVGTGMQNILGTERHRTERHRKARIDGEQMKSSDALLQHVRVIWLVPAMDGLFTGSAGERRRYLDRLVLAIDPAHGKRVSSFEKSMRARNKLLTENNPDKRWLDAIEIQMAEYAVAIASARVETISLLSSVIIKSDDIQFSFPDALISLDGMLESMISDSAASDLEAEYANTLCRQRHLDATARRTLRGPHNTDMKVYHRPKGMHASLCSTGEQKALLVGLTLAQARLSGELQGRAPIILLDEITAHLDREKCSALFDIIDRLGCQAWMSGVDRNLFNALGKKRANYISVEAGKAGADKNGD